MQAGLDTYPNMFGISIDRTISKIILSIQGAELLKQIPLTVRLLLKRRNQLDR